MNITVAKLTRDPLLAHQVRIDRITAMGNPFLLLPQANDTERDRNLSQYRIYLNRVIRQAIEPPVAAADLANAHKLQIPTTWGRPNRLKFMREYQKLVEQAQHQPLELMCFCHPKKCHGDILKSAIEWSIEQSKVLIDSV